MSYELKGVISNFLEGSIKTIGKVPNIEQLNVTSNGTYTPSTGVDGFAPVVVNIPEPVITSVKYTENGTYTPPSNVDGYNEIEVDVPEAILESKSITSNGNYTPPSGVDGFSSVSVNVQPTLETKNITSNGTYTPSTGYDGFSSVSVNVPVPTPTLEEISITSNGTYTPPSGVDGYNQIVVNVTTPIDWVLNNVYIENILYMSTDYQYNFDQPIDSGMYIMQFTSSSNNLVSRPLGLYFDGTNMAQGYAQFQYGNYLIKLYRTHMLVNYTNGDYLGGYCYCKMSKIDITGRTY